MNPLDLLRFPTGKFVWPAAQPSLEDKSKALSILKDFPKLLKEEVSSLNENQLRTPYREGGWTVAQVVHHLADSHSHAYLRCKHALLEDTPKIKDYTESDWAKLDDASASDVSPSLSIIDGIHHRWVSFFSKLSSSQMERTYYHPEGSKEYPLYVVLAIYSWHSMHHLEHIRVLKKKNW